MLHIYGSRFLASWHAQPPGGRSTNREWFGDACWARRISWARAEVSHCGNYPPADCGSAQQELRTPGTKRKLRDLTSEPILAPGGGRTKGVISILVKSFWMMLWALDKRGKQREILPRASGEKWRSGARGRRRSLLPFSSARTARGPYRADPDVVIHSRLHAAERPLAGCETQTRSNGRCSGVYGRLKMLWDCKILQNTAKKPEGRIGFETRRRRPYVVL